MSDQRVYNFSAGPSMLPLSALERAGSEITNYQGTGISVMEMSHRSKMFLKIHEETQNKFRRILGVPEGYKILFLQTGATGQFSMIVSTAPSMWPPPPRTASTPTFPPRIS